jgi:hypothetical protein
MANRDVDRDLQMLQGANLLFSQFFQRFSGSPVLGTDEEVQAMRQIEHSLQSVALALDSGLPNSVRPEVREELVRYRTNLLHMRQELIRMEISANEGRACLQARQKQMRAARAWCAASRAITT